MFHECGEQKLTRRDALKRAGSAMRCYGSSETHLAFNQPIHPVAARLAVLTLPRRVPRIEQHHSTRFEHAQNSQHGDGRDPGARLQWQGPDN